MASSTPRVLYLASNPTNADRLKLGEEARTIQAEIDRFDGQLDLVTRWAAQPLDLLRELRQLRPAVLHFAGYGGQDGIYCQDRNGDAKLVTTEAITATLEAAGSSVVLVVLNACYTADLAVVLTRHVGSVKCVIGTASIDDEAARAFAREFYRALAAGASVGKAYGRGCSVPEIERLTARHSPLIEAVMDPEHLFISPRA